MWSMLQQEQPGDFVIATREYYGVRNSATLALHYAGIEFGWRGKGMNEKDIDETTGKVLVKVDPKYPRPAEVERSLGDPTKAEEKLGWNSHQTNFEELVKRMVEYDLKNVKKQGK